MQQRRLRPGDVLDDYCPRERRITDHAIVAMIDDEIKQTRCVSCDAEHEYKQGKVPPQRRKKAPAALFTQVLDGLQGPARIAPNAGTSAPPDEEVDEDASDIAPPDLSMDQPDRLPEREHADASADASRFDEAQGSPDPSILRPAQDRPDPSTSSGSSRAQLKDEQGRGARDTADTSEPARDIERAAEEGPVRRPLIRAQLPRPEGQQPPARDLPDFTIRQPSSSRGNRPGGQGSRGRRHAGGQQQGQGGGTRFGSEGRPNQFGRSGERRHGGGGRRGPGPGQGQGHGHGGRPNRGGRRGGGKKY